MLIESLIQRAQVYWSMGDPLPLDLTLEMAQAGIIVSEAESKFLHIKNGDKDNGE